MKLIMEKNSNRSGFNIIKRNAKIQIVFIMIAVTSRKGVFSSEKPYLIVIKIL